jgi:large subunit ribosomal protein L24
MPFEVSNVMYYCDACQAGVRLGLRFTTDGAKERFCRKCGKSAGQVSPPRAPRASS